MTKDMKGILADELLNHVIEIIPPVPHHRSLQYLFESDILLIIQPRAPLQIPAKLFEYMYLRKPILAITEEDSATADIIRQAQLGIIVDPEDIPSIKKAIQNLYRQYQTGTLPSYGDISVIQQYDVRILALKFARLLDKLL